ncbi:hypothetical protein ACPCUF_32430 [Streptomyces griseoincarnatus]
MTDPGTPQALRHLWASPALFVLGGVRRVRRRRGPEAGWALVPLALPALFAMAEGIPGTGAHG